MGADQRETHAAQRAIGEVFAKLHITQVICVDDAYEMAPEVAPIVGAFDALRNAHRKACARLLTKVCVEVDLDAPEEVWKGALERQWNERLDASAKRFLVAELALLLGREQSGQLGLSGQDAHDARTMRGLFPPQFRPLELGPNNWTAQRDGLLGAATRDARVLCLFDQNLEHAEGFSSEGSRSGIGLMRETVGRYTDGSVICGLLSHTLTLNDERLRWEALAAASGLTLGQFLPLAKERLTQPLLFADGIKKTAMNLDCEAMKRRVVDIVRQASNKAEEQLAHLDVYTFDRMVLESSFNEGVWEVDTLFRVHNIFHRDAAKRLTLEEDNCAAFNAAIERVRAIRKVTAGEYARNHPPGQRLEVRHQELYEGAALINELHSPLETGDLFALVAEGAIPRTFVLVAQPCDLVIRKNGKRRSTTVPLIPVTILTAEQAAGKELSFWRVRFPLPYYTRATSDIGVVEFPQAQSVRVDVLDLAVLNDEGRCRLELTRNEPAPPQLNSGWKNRRQQIAAGFEKSRRTLDELRNRLEGAGLDDGTREDVLRAVMPKVSLTDFGLPELPYHDGVFDFGLHRISRYRQPGAGILLSEYTRYLSRPAEDHDFGR